MRVARKAQSMDIKIGLGTAQIHDREGGVSDKSHQAAQNYKAMVPRLESNSHALSISGKLLQQQLRGTEQEDLAENRAFVYTLGGRIVQRRSLQA